MVNNKINSKYTVILCAGLESLFRDEMSFIEVSGYVRIRAINVISPGFKGY